MLSHSTLTFPKYEDISVFGGLPRDMLILILEIYFGERFYIRGTEGYYRYMSFIYRIPIYYMHTSFTLWYKYICNGDYNYYYHNNRWYSSNLFISNEHMLYRKNINHPIKFIYHPPINNLLTTAKHSAVIVPITLKQGRIYANLDLDIEKPHIRNRHNDRKKNAFKIQKKKRKTKRYIIRKRFIDTEGGVPYKVFQDDYLFIQ